MAYTTPYVSNPYEPRQYDRQSGRLSDLIRTRANAEAQGIQGSGAVQAAMWANTGAAVGNTLAQLAQFKADEPKRQEQERQFNEAAQLRELDKNAGSLGLDTAARADMYDQAGFRKQAMAERDAERVRQSQTADEASKALAREQERLSRAANRLHGIKDGAAYIAARESILKDAPELERMLPSAYDPTAIENAKTFAGTAQDQAHWSARAASEAALALNQEEGSRKRFDSTRNSIISILKPADNPEQWAKAWMTIDATFTGENAEAIKQMFPREFSQTSTTQIDEFAAALKPDQNMSALDRAFDAFQTKHGRKPDEAETQRIISNTTDSSTRFNPNTGGGRGNGGVTGAQQRSADSWAQGEYYKAETQFKKDLAEGELTKAQAEAALVDRKRNIKAMHNIRLGMPDAPGFDEVASTRGQDGMGRSLSDAAGPMAPPNEPRPAAPTQAPVQAPVAPPAAAPRPQQPAGGRQVAPPGYVMMIAPDGSGVMPVAEAQVADAIAAGARPQTPASLPDGALLPPPPVAPRAAAPVAAPAAPPPSQRPPAPPVASPRGSGYVAPQAPSRISQLVNHFLTGSPDASAVANVQKQIDAAQRAGQPLSAELQRAWELFKRDIRK